jgi:hypothetical protein
VHFGRQLGILGLTRVAFVRSNHHCAREHGSAGPGRRRRGRRRASAGGGHQRCSAVV